MKKYFLFIALLFYSLFSFAQAGFVTTGGDASSGDGSVSYSTGQLGYNAYNNSTHIIIEGLQQPWEIGRPVPVSMLYFTATPGPNKTVNIKWSTVNEINNDYFIIERSKDGLNFDFLKSVPAMGNSSARIDYSSIDESPYDGYSYYRLKQVDRDGQFSYTQIERVYFQGPKFLATVYPNPTKDIVQIKINGEINNYCKYRLIDINGRGLAEGVIVDNFTLVNLKNKPQATYILQIINAGKIIQSFKIIKSK